jgi:RNA polymerase sigma-70 factor (ECF subfamily)
MLMFQAGWQADRRELSWEAIRLARALAAHPAAAHADADALAALLLLHGARLSGRLDDAGDIVPLPGQPRDRWDAGMLRMGLAHLQAAQRAQALSRWHLLAGIAAEHAMAPDWSSTNWPAIVRFYELLVHIDPSAAPRLGHAIALAEGGAAGEARARLEALLPDTPEALRAHVLAALARAHEREGDRVAAGARLREAILLARHDADARLLARRLATLEP